MNGLLLVDADPQERRRLARGLVSCGWNVQAVPDAASARHFIREQPDLIQAALVDLQLPGFLGRHLLDELAALVPPPVCIAMSHRPNAASVEIFRRISRSPLLVKPVTVEQADTMLENLRDTPLQTVEAGS